ncbi:hypothetical protein BH20ACT24_BH20ACT24_12460 [soil metagenome]
MSGEDLSSEALAALLPGRPIRSYPALLSTAADALAWARSGAPEGGIVVADYQASPRGRAGLEWSVRPGRSLAFSLILRPDLSPEREGWLYTVAASGLHDALDGASTIEWPDQVRAGQATIGAVGVEVELGPEGVAWAVLNVLVPDAAAPRGPLLERVVGSIEARYRSPAEAVLADYLGRCQTIGERVVAKLIPMGPSGLRVAGTATGSKTDGALVIETVRGSHVAVRPQNLGALEREAPATGTDPDYPDYRKWSRSRAADGGDPSTD